MTRAKKIGCHKNTGTRISPGKDLPQQKLAIVEGQKYEFAGNYYGCFTPDDWQYGLCPVCGNVSGRMTIGRQDYCFCMKHRTAWLAGINCFGDEKEKWYTDEIKEKNAIFLQEVFHLTEEN